MMESCLQVTAQSSRSVTQVTNTLKYLIHLTGGFGTETSLTSGAGCLQCSEESTTFINSFKNTDNRCWLIIVSNCATRPHCCRQVWCLASFHANSDLYVFNARLTTARFNRIPFDSRNAELDAAGTATEDRAEADMFTRSCLWSQGQQSCLIRDPTAATSMERAIYVTA